MSNLGLPSCGTGKPGGGEVALSRPLAMRRRALGDGHPEISQTLGLLGSLLRCKGDLVAAESIYVRAIEVGRQALGAEHPDLSHTINGLAVVSRQGRCGGGRSVDAESSGDPAAHVRRRASGYRGEPHAAGRNSAGKGQYDAAEPLLLEALAMRRRTPGDAHPRVGESAHALIGLYESPGRASRARAYDPLVVAWASAGSPAVGR